MPSKIHFHPFSLMRDYFMRSSIILLLLLLPALGCAASDPTVLNAQITYLGDTLTQGIKRDPEITRIAVTSEKGDDPALSIWFARALESDLVAREAFIVLDRENLDRLLLEQKLVLSDIFDERYRPRIGQLLGADALVIAEIQPGPNQTFYALRGRLVDLETGRVLVSGSATLAAEDLDFSEGTASDRSGGNIFTGTGNALLALLKLPVTPVTMVLDIFETACVEERGAGSRVSDAYPMRVVIGLWEGIPLPFPWISGTFNNDLYLTRSMWNSWL
jgi:hypothetical protein